jgi:hypothetical protein
VSESRSDIGKITGLFRDVETEIGVREDAFIDAPILDSVLGRN